MSTRGKTKELQNAEFPSSTSDRDLTNRVTLGYVKVHQCTDQYKLWKSYGVGAHDQLQTHLVVEDLRRMLDGKIAFENIGVCYTGLTDIPNATGLSPSMMANAYFMKTGHVLEWLVIVKRHGEMEDYGIGGFLVSNGSPLVYSSTADGQDESCTSKGAVLAPAEFNYMEKYIYRSTYKAYRYKGDILEKFARPFALCHVSKDAFAVCEEAFLSLRALCYTLEESGYAGWEGHTRPIKIARSDVLAEMSCGLYQQNDLRWIQNYRWECRKMSPFRWLMEDFVAPECLDELEEYAPYRKMVDDLEKICDLWEPELFHLYHKKWATFFPVEVLENAEEDVAVRHGRENQLAAMLRAVALETGIDAKLKTYAQGVPFEDIEN